MYLKWWIVSTEVPSAKSPSFLDSIFLNSSPSLLFTPSIPPLLLWVSVVFTLGGSYVYGGLSVRGRGQGRG